MLNQRQINAFRLVIRHGSITAASQAMHVSQPAVSRLIADLEHAVGFPLLVRTGGKARPTPEALEFIQEVERMFYGLDRLALAADEIRELRRATLRLASMPMVSFEIVPLTLQRLLASHRGIRVTHDVHTSSRILDLLASHQIDLGIAQTHAGRSDLEVVAAFHSDCVCVMTPDHPLAGRDSLGPEDLAGQPLISLSHHTVTAGYTIQRFAEAGVRPEIIAETQPSYSACAMAALGVGIAIVDPITPRLWRRDLAAVPFRPEIPFDFQILKPADVALSRASAAFVQAMLGTLQGLPDISRTDHKL